MRPLEAINAGITGTWSLSGRATRPEFWWFVAFLFGVGAICGYFQAVAMHENDRNTYLVANLVAMCFFPAAVCATRRRQRDVFPQVPNVSFLVFFGIGKPAFYDTFDVFRLGGCVCVGMLLLIGPMMVFSILLNSHQPENATSGAVAVAMILFVLFGWPLPNLLRASAKPNQPPKPSPKSHEVPQ